MSYKSIKFTNILYDEKNLYQEQLQIVQAYLELLSKDTNSSKLLITLLQNAVDKIEAVYSRTKRELLLERNSEHRLNHVLGELNQVFANIRLIYLPQNYDPNLDTNRPEERISHISDESYNISPEEKNNNFNLLINRLPGIYNKLFIQIGVALLLLTLVCVSVAIIFSNPSIIGLTFGCDVFGIIALSLASLSSGSACLTFFSSGFNTPNLFQAAQKLSEIAPQYQLN